MISSTRAVDMTCYNWLRRLYGIIYQGQADTATLTLWEMCCYCIYVVVIRVSWYIETGYIHKLCQIWASNSTSDATVRIKTNIDDENSSYATRIKASYCMRVQHVAWSVTGIPILIPCHSRRPSLIVIASLSVYAWYRRHVTIGIHGLLGPTEEGVSGSGFANKVASLLSLGIIQQPHEARLLAAISLDRFHGQGDVDAIVCVSRIVLISNHTVDFDTVPPAAVNFSSSSFKSCRSPIKSQC